jgi:hypothetical protein
MLAALLGPSPFEARRKRASHLRVTEMGSCEASLILIYLIACGLIGLPVPPVMISGGPQKKNS